MRQFASTHINPKIFAVTRVNAKQFASTHTNPRVFASRQIEDLSDYFLSRYPSLLTQTVFSATRNDLAWTNNGVQDYDNISIERSADNITFAAINTAVVGAVAFSDTTAIAGVPYFYKIRYAKGSSYSAYSNIAKNQLFIFTVDTTKAGSAVDTFVLPTFGAGYNAYVNWGDGSAEQNITGTPGNVSKVYAAPGTYQIKIRGVFPQIYFNDVGDKLKFSSIDNWGSGVWRSMLWAFGGCRNMIGAYNDVPDTSVVTTMNVMFAYCYAFNAKVNFNTSAVTTMDSMFYSCFAFNQSVSNLNTSAVTDISYMFALCSAFKQSLATFTITNVTNLGFFAQSTNINVGATTTNYDDTLVSWAVQAVKPNLTTNFGTSKYGAGAGAAARLVLTSAPNNWTITDGGQL